MPVTTEELEEIADTVSKDEGYDALRIEVQSYLLKLSTLTERCRDMGEIASRCWQTVQKIPQYCTAESPEGQASAMVQAMRRRLLPKLRQLDTMAMEFRSLDPFDYLAPQHPLRRVRNFKPKAVADNVLSQLQDFELSANGLYTMDEVIEDIHEVAQGLVGLVGGFGTPSWKDYVGWKVQEVEIGGVKLGPWYAIIRLGPAANTKSSYSPHLSFGGPANPEGTQGAAGGFRRSMPWLFPQPSAKIADYQGNKFWHTHVNQYGEVCFGDQASRVRDIVKAGDYWSLVDMLDLTLECWNPESPHCQLIAFDPEAERAFWECACGRRSVGSKPTNAKGTIAFLSCFSCAEDVCSHCAKACSKCGNNQICTECTRYLLDRKTNRTFGPYCQDCHDYTVRGHPDYISDEDDPSVKEEQNKAEAAARHHLRAATGVNPPSSATVFIEGGEAGATQGASTGIWVWRRGNALWQRVVAPYA